GAGLLVRSMMALHGVPVGVTSDHRLTLRVAPGWASMPERAQADVMFHAMEERIAALPGVTAVGAVNRLPLEGNWWAGGLTVRGQAALPRDQQPTVVNRIVTAGYFKAAGVRLLRGRLPNESDRADGVKVMAISETLARQLWGNADPLGSTVTN